MSLFLGRDPNSPLKMSELLPARGPQIIKNVTEDDIFDIGRKMYILKAWKIVLNRSRMSKHSILGRF